jgi:MFS family permease
MRSRAWAVLAVVSVAQFMVLLDATVVNVALPRMRRELPVGAGAVPWVLDAYAVTFGGLLLLGGRVADLVGRRTVFLAGLLAFVAASLGCGLSTSATELVAARAVQGAAAAFLSPAALAIVTAAFTHGAGRQTALSIWGGLGGLGATVGVVLGGLLVGAFGWPWAFLVNVPLGLAAAGLAVRLVPDGRPAARRGGLGVTGAACVTAALVLLVLAVVSVRDVGWAAPVPVAVAAVVLLALFVVVERRSAAPMVPADVVRNRALRIGAVGQFLVGATQLSVMFLLSRQAQEHLGLSPLRAGLSVVPVGVVAVGAALAASRLVRRIGLRATYALASACGLAGLVLFAALAGGGPGTYLRSMLGPSLLAGLALPMASVVGTIVGTWRLDEERAGVASGVLNASFQVGSALGLAVVAAVAADGLRGGYLVAAGFEALALVNAGLGIPFAVAASRVETMDGQLYTE